VIGRLRGVPAGRRGDILVLDVGGVGYLVQATPTVLKAAGDAELTVETYLHVREDALQLYGFADGEERELFEHLLSVSGVGPKVALAIVSGSRPAEPSRSTTRPGSRRSRASAARPRNASSSS
jgi:Holliday junction DNA helicase RuvA